MTFLTLDMTFTQMFTIDVTLRWKYGVIIRSLRVDRT